MHPPTSPRIRHAQSVPPQGIHVLKSPSFLSLPFQFDFVKGLFILTFPFSAPIGSHSNEVWLLLSPKPLSPRSLMTPFCRVQGPHFSHILFESSVPFNTTGTTSLDAFSHNPCRSSNLSALLQFTSSIFPFKHIRLLQCSIPSLITAHVSWDLIHSWFQWPTTCWRLSAFYHQPRLNIQKPIAQNYANGPRCLELNRTQTRMIISSQPPIHFCSHLSVLGTNT